MGSWQNLVQFFFLKPNFMAIKLSETFDRHYHPNLLLLVSFKAYRFLRGRYLYQRNVSFIELNGILDFTEIIALQTSCTNEIWIAQSGFSKRKQLCCPDVKFILTRKPLKLGNVSRSHRIQKREMWHKDIWHKELSLLVSSILLLGFV